MNVGKEAHEARKPFTIEATENAIETCMYPSVAEVADTIVKDDPVARSIPAAYDKSSLQHGKWDGAC